MKLRKIKISIHLPLLASLALVALAVATPSMAATQTWTNGTNTWDAGTTADWSGAVWTNGNDAYMQAGGTATVAGTITVKSITAGNAFLSIGGTNGGVLQIGSGGITATGAGGVSIANSVAVQLTASQSWAPTTNGNSGADMLAVNANVTDTTGTSTLTVSNAGGFKVLALSGSDSLTNLTVTNTKNNGNDYVLVNFGNAGTATGTFGGSVNTNFGVSTISGTLNLTNSGGTGYSIVNVSNSLSVDKINSAGTTLTNDAVVIGQGGNLTIGYNGGSSTFSGRILNSTSTTTPGTITKSGAGTLTLNGDSLTQTTPGQLGVCPGFSGTWKLNGGVLNAGSVNATGSNSSTITFGGGAFQYSSTFASGTNADISGRIKNSTAGAIAIDTNGQNVTFASALANTNTGGLTKSGSGVLTLSAAANLTGAITVTSGTLKGVVTNNGSGTLTIGSGAAYNPTGSMTVGGLATINGTGLLDMRDGTAGQTLTLGGGLTLNDTNALAFDIGASSDSINLSGGSFSLGSGTVTINFTKLTGFGNGTYNLITGASGISASNFSLGTTVTGYNLSLINTSTALELQVTALAPTTAYWKGGQGSVWNTNNSGSTNWNTDATSGVDTGATPSTPTAVIFSANGATNEANTTLGADTTIDSLTINSANSVGIGGANTLTLINANGITVNAGAGAATISTGGLVLGSNQTWVNNSNNKLTVSAPVSGAQSLTTSGSGTILLSSSNSYSGGTTISSGTLKVGNTNALGSGAVVDNATLDLNGTALSIAALSGTSNAVITNSNATAASVSTTVASGTSTFAGTINDGAGTVALTKNGSGVFAVTGSNSYSGGSTINAGTLAVGGSNALGTGAVTMAASTTLNTVSAAMVANNMTVNGTVAINSTGGALALTGSIGGSGSLNVTPTNIITLTGANGYSGGTTLNTGTVAVGGSSPLGTGTVSFAGGTLVNTANIALANNISTTSNIANLTAAGGTMVVNGNITGANGATLVPTNKITLAGTNSFCTGGSAFTVTTGAGGVDITGSTTVGNGNGASATGFLNINGDVTVTLQAGGSLGILGTTNATKPNSIIGQDAVGTSSLVVNGGSLTIGGNTGFAIGNNKTAAIGILTVSSGTATITAGSSSLQNTLNFVALGRDGATGIVNLDGGMLATGRQFVRDGSGGANAGGGTGTATFNFNGGTLQALATQTAGNGWFETATSGTFQVVTTNVKDGGAIIDTNGFDVNIGTVLAHASTAATDGGLIKNGAGKLTLAGASTYNGATSVNGGTLIVSGSLNATSAVTVASGATLQTNGLINTSAAISLAGTLSGSGTVGAVNVNAGGTLSASTANLTTGALSLSSSGTFALSINTALGTTSKVTASSLSLDASNAAVLTITDNGVDTALAIGTKFAFLDYSGSAPVGLFTYVGNVLNNGDSILLGSNNYTINYFDTDNGSSAVSLTVAAIPEPGTWAMVVSGLGMLSFWQRARRKSA